MRLVWVVIPLVLFGIIGITESDAQCVQGSQEPCLDEIAVYRYEYISQDLFELQITKEAFFELEKIHVKLLDIEDSRCPSDVQCVWEGQVAVNVNVGIGESAFKIQKDLGNYTISLNDALKLPAIQGDQYFLQLINVEPHPISTESIHVSDYVATMKLFVTEILSPLKQVNKGISSENIKCKNELELIFKPSDNSPACVKPSTAEKLIQRGWANQVIENKSDIINGCKDVRGDWLDEHNECESVGITEAFENYCSDFDGTYHRCQSGCRHSPDYPNVICAAVCVTVCEFN